MKKYCTQGKNLLVVFCVYLDEIYDAILEEPFKEGEKKLFNYYEVYYS